MVAVVAVAGREVHVPAAVEPVQLGRPDLLGVVTVPVRVPDDRLVVPADRRQVAEATNADGAVVRRRLHEEQLPRPRDDPRVLPGKRNRLVEDQIFHPNGFATRSSSRPNSHPVVSSTHTITVACTSGTLSSSRMHSVRAAGQNRLRPSRRHNRPCRSADIASTQYTTNASVASASRGNVTLPGKRSYSHDSNHPPVTRSQTIAPNRASLAMLRWVNQRLRVTGHNMLRIARSRGGLGCGSATESAENTTNATVR